MRQDPKGLSSAYLERLIFHFLCEDPKKHGDRKEVKISYYSSLTEQMSHGNIKHKVLVTLFRFHFPHITLRKFMHATKYPPL